MVSVTQKKKGSAVCSIAFAWSVSNNLPFPLDYHFVYFLLVAFSLLNFALSFKLSKWLVYLNMSWNLNNKNWKRPSNARLTEIHHTLWCPTTSTSKDIKDSTSTCDLPTGTLHLALQIPQEHCTLAEKDFRGRRSQRSALPALKAFSVSILSCGKGQWGLWRYSTTYSTDGTTFTQAKVLQVSRQWQLMSEIQ